MISKSQQKLVLQIHKYEKLLAKQQTIYGTPSEFFTTISYLRDNGILEHNSVPQNGARYVHSYYLTDIGKIFAIFLKTLDSSNGEYDKSINFLKEVKEIVRGVK